MITWNIANPAFNPRNPVGPKRLRIAGPTRTEAEVQYFTRVLCQVSKKAARIMGVA